MHRQLGAALEVVPSSQYTFASPFASDAFGSTGRSLDPDNLSAQSSMLSASSTDQQHQSQRLAGYLAGSNMERLGEQPSSEGSLCSQPSRNTVITFQAMDDAVTAVFGGPMTQLPADGEGGLDSSDHVIQRRYSMGSMRPSKLRVISHDLDLSAGANSSFHLRRTWHQSMLEVMAYMKIRHGHGRSTPMIRSNCVPCLFTHVSSIVSKAL